MCSDYQPFYCEENIWKLCDRGVPRGSLVIFISNEIREVILLQQRAGDSEHGMVGWDYHVILAEPENVGWLIRDFDTRLEFPCRWPIYREHTFPELPPELARWSPRFRVIAAEVFHQQFASDRSHMRTADGTWMRPPPHWDPIGEGSNLMNFVDLQNDFLGTVVGLDDLLADNLS